MKDTEISFRGLGSGRVGDSGPKAPSLEHQIAQRQDGVKLLPRFVGYGITSVRDMASPPDDILRL